MRTILALLGIAFIACALSGKYIPGKIVHVPVGQEGTGCKLLINGKYKDCEYRDGWLYYKNKPYSRVRIKKED